MKLFILLITIRLAVAQDVSDYLEKIRANESFLTAFFSQMPKGGDLHHHYSGSVYAETYLDFLMEKDYWVNTRTLDVDSVKRPNEGWVRLSSLKADNQLDNYKQKLISKWSVKDYDGISAPSDKHFFDTFSYFNLPSKLSHDRGLAEIKARAKSENVSYIETMFTGIPCGNVKMSDPAYFNDTLRKAAAAGDEKKIDLLLSALYDSLAVKGFRECAAAFNKNVVEKYHKSLGIDDSTFVMRYQNYVRRTLEPADIFRDLVIAFESADKSPLVVGVNIVAPEDNAISMQDYSLHMHMFRFCHSRYPDVRYSMHAGELAPGLVKPEELTWHISAAVRTAGARRIGHGVDIAREKDCYKLMKEMKEKDVAVEINLSSNEFILKVKDDSHPILLYREAGVPVVISTDDAGVLRTSLTDQFVILARRYPSVSYADIKQYVYNSIKYSFIEEKATKARLISDLDERFRAFESLFPPR